MTTRTTEPEQETLPDKPAGVPAKVTPRAAVKQTLEQYRPVIAALLPSHVDERHFLATVANACRKTPALWECDPSTVLAGALRAAQLGLELNDERNLCFLIPRGKQATFQLGYGGVLELARRATPGLRFAGDIVREGDTFEEVSGSEPRLHHVKPLTGRGEAIAWYVVAFFPDRSKQWVVLDRDGVEYHRSFSAQPNGQMWTKSYDAAALKSCVLELRRWLPASPEMAKAQESDEQVVTMATLAAEVEEDEMPALEAG